MYIAKNKGIFYLLHTNLNNKYLIIHNYYILLLFLKTTFLTSYRITWENLQEEP